MSCTTPHVRLLREMVETPSVSRGEGALAALLEDRMSERGYRTCIDPVGNVVGRTGCAGPEILLLGHLDTVPGAPPIRLVGNRLYGRGAVDAKGPLAAMICAAQLAPIPARLTVAGVVEEELPESTGARHLIDTLSPPDAVIVGEPSGWSGIGIGYRGRIGFAVEVQRPASHCGAPAEKATEVAAALWTSIRDHVDQLHATPDLFGRTTATLESFHGDLERARMVLSCRTPPGFDFDAFEEFLRAASDDARLTFDERTPAVLTHGADPVVVALKRAIRAHGARPTLKRKTGTCDMNLIRHAWPVPIAAYGPGDSKLDHTADEHLDLDEFEAGIRVLHDALQWLAQSLASERST